MRANCVESISGVASPSRLVAVAVPIMQLGPGLTLLSDTIKAEFICLAELSYASLQTRAEST